MNQINILLATYNGAPYLDEQLDSLFNQTYTKWHLFIHDDNSSDDSVEIIKRYSEQYPEKITLIDDNISYNSASANFSSLLRHVTTKYVMFCDQDDIWLSTKIALTVEKMQALEVSFPNEPLLVHTDLTVVDEELKTIADSYWDYQHLHPSALSLNKMLVQNVITGCTIMINKKLYTKALPIPDNAIMHDWWLGLVASSFGQIYHITTPTILYRQHSNNDTGAKVFDLQTIIEKALSLSKTDLHKYINQAKVLLERYEAELTVDQRELLLDFVNIENTSWLAAKKTLLNHKILKQGLFRNVGLFICKNQTTSKH